MDETALETDIDDLIGLVAAKHGIRMGRNDPFVVVPTLVRLRVERAVKDLTADGEARKQPM